MKGSHILNSAIDIAKLIQKLTIYDYPKPIEVTWKLYKNKRTLPQNDLMWKWNGEILKYLIKSFPKHYADWTTKRIHTMHKHTFLGHRDEEMIDIVTKEKTTYQVLRSTTELDKGEMHHFMNDIYYYWVDKKLFLTVPELSEYFKNEKVQNE